MLFIVRGYFKRERIFARLAYLHHNFKGLHFLLRVEPFVSKPSGGQQRVKAQVDQGVTEVPVFGGLCLASLPLHSIVAEQGYSYFLTAGYCHRRGDGIGIGDR